jgi:hypothetical protein
VGGDRIRCPTRARIGGRKVLHSPRFPAHVRVKQSGGRAGDGDEDDDDDDDDDKVEWPRREERTRAHLWAEDMRR